eukprot:gene14161-19001_t
MTSRRRKDIESNTNKQEDDIEMNVKHINDEEHYSGDNVAVNNDQEVGNENTPLIDPESASANQPNKNPGSKHFSTNTNLKNGSVDKIDSNKMITDSIANDKNLEPIRMDPIKTTETRRKRLERQSIEQLPEIHFIGEIKFAKNVILDYTEGCFCRYKIEHGHALEHLGGDLVGSTQVSYCAKSIHENISLNHPIDAHFASAGIQGWGSPVINIQCFRIDWYQRKILAGYGFVHLPLISGHHKIQVKLWRPVGNPEQELGSFLLGQTPALLSHEPIYESSWKDRCRLVTVAAGELNLELFVATRYFKSVGIDEK